MRRLEPVRADAAALLPALAAALDGSGPAVLPLPAPTTSAERAAALAALLAELRPEEPLERDDVALVVPTSGSTGRPRGVLLTASALLASATATAARLGGPGQWLLALPATHIGGVQVLVRSLLAGLDPVVLPGGPFRPAGFAAATAQLTGERRYVSLVPTQLRRLVDAEMDLTRYDAVLLGGAAAPPSLLAAAATAGARVVTTYGMTETSGGCVYDGRPLNGVRVSVDEGRIRLAGPVLALGYRLRPDLDPLFAGGWFATGDLGRLDVDGRLEILGRADDVIISGGENVPPAAVEAALATHPAVLEAAVVGRPDDQWGERVVAHVVLGAPLTLAAARDHVAATLPRSWAPRELHALDVLPVLPSGKVDRAGLR